MREENEEKKNGRSTWEVKYKQIEMQNELLESKLQPQIIAEAKGHSRSLLEATMLDPLTVCWIFGIYWTLVPCPQGEMIAGMIFLPPSLYQ